MVCLVNLASQVNQVGLAIVATLASLVLVEFLAYLDTQVSLVLVALVVSLVHQDFLASLVLVEHQEPVAYRVNLDIVVTLVLVATQA